MQRLSHWMKSTAAGMCLGGALALAAPVLASEADAARLGADLTPNGAETAGNADGSIPAFDGGYKSSAPHTPGAPYPDPFAADAIKATVTNGNAAQHDALLLPGHKAMLAKHPTYKMNIYPTRRSCGIPAEAAGWNKKNAATGKLVADGNGVADAFYAQPFPVPENGLEVLWNHLLRYRGYAFQRDYIGAVVYPSGQVSRVRIQDEGVFRWSDPSKSRIEDLDNKAIYFLQQVIEPTRMAGTALLVHETINQVAMPRQVWTYNPGQRRVRRAPDVQYDNPGTGSDNLTTSDQLSNYNGAPDRYDWELKGKREAYIPYNTYKLAAKETSIASLTTPNHLNQDPIRYENHRVWVVEGKLKAGTRHIYHRRTFYQDEDSWFIVAGELYDARGELWRVQEGYLINYYDQENCGEVGTVSYDLQSGGYYVSGLTNETKTIRFDGKISDDRFNPNNLRQIGVR